MTPPFALESLHVDLRSTCKVKRDRHDAEDDHLVQWEATLLAREYPEDVEDEVDTEIATTRFYVLEYEKYRAWDALDAHSADLAAYICLFDDDGGLRSDVKIEEPHLGSILIWDTMTVKPEYRGHRYGPLLGAVAITELVRGRALVACYPSAFEIDRDDPAKALADARLNRMWRKFGFTLFENGVWILDPALTTLGKTLAALKGEKFTDD